MKISINDTELFSITEIQKKVLSNDIHRDTLEDDLKRRLQWVLMHKYQTCFDNLKQEWDKKLASNGIKSVPTDADEYAQLVFNQPNYKDRKDRSGNLGE